MFHHSRPQIRCQIGRLINEEKLMKHNVILRLLSIEFKVTFKKRNTDTHKHAYVHVHMYQGCGELFAV